MSKDHEIASGIEAHQGNCSTTKEVVLDTADDSGTSAGLDKALRKANKRRAQRERTANYWNQEHHTFFADLLPDEAEFNDYPPPKVIFTTFPDLRPISNLIKVNLIACWMVKQGTLQESNPVKKQWMINRYNDHCWRKTMEDLSKEAASGGLRKSSFMVQRRIAREASRLPTGGITQDEYLLVKHGKARISFVDGKYVVSLRNCVAATVTAALAASSTTNALSFANADVPYDGFSVLSTALITPKCIPVDPFTTFVFIFLAALVYYIGHCEEIRYDYREIQRRVNILGSFPNNIRKKLNRSGQ